MMNEYSIAADGPKNFGGNLAGGPVGAIENNFHAPGFFIHLAVHLAQVDLLLQPIHVRCVQPGSILQG